MDQQMHNSQKKTIAVKKNKNDKNCDSTASLTDVSVVVTKADLVNLQHELNKSMDSFYQKMTEEIAVVLSKLVDLPKVFEKVKQLEIENEENKRQITTINGNLLILEDEFKKQQILTNTNNTKRNEATAKLLRSTKLLENNLKISNDAIDRRFKELEERVNKKETIKVVSEIPDTLRNSLRTLEERVKDMEQTTKNIRDVPDGNKRNQSTKNVVQQIDCDVLILGDSNTGKINPNLMNNHSKTMKIFCPTFTDIDKCLKNSSFTRIPSKIILHCGCNDIDQFKMDPIKIVNTIEETLRNIKDQFPDIHIFVSTLFPRQDNTIECIEIINDFIRSLHNKPSITVINNSNIRKDMLQDNKHVNNSGLYTFLANIKFAVFGEMPKIYSPHRNYGTHDHRARSFSNNRKNFRR